MRNQRVELGRVVERRFRFDDIWAAAGHPHSVFQLTPNQLCFMTGVNESDVVEWPLADMPAGERPNVRVVDTHSAYFTALVTQTKAARGSDYSICDIDLPSDVK